MLDHAGLPPDLSLFVQPGDDIHFVCTSVHSGCGWRGKAGLIYVVVHRSQGLWTHVYRVVQDQRRGQLAVFVEKVIEGDHAGAAGDWARASFSSLGVEHGLAVIGGGPAAKTQALRP